MSHSAANVIVLEPLPARHIAPSPGVGGEVLQIKRPRKGMRYPGLQATSARSRGKYDRSLRVRVAGGEARMLSPAELAEWHARIAEIINDEGHLRRQPLRPEERL